MTKQKRGRDAETGKFISVKEAEKRKKTAIVETFDKPQKKTQPPKKKTK